MMPPSQTRGCGVQRILHLLPADTCQPVRGHGAGRYSTVQYSTVQYSTVQYSTGRPIGIGSLAMLVCTVILACTTFWRGSEAWLALSLILEILK